MTKKAMRFAVVRFMPHIPTREFANIGVIVVCPTTAYFDFKLADEPPHRLNFFPRFDVAVYRTAVIAFRAELQRVQAQLRSQHASAECYRLALDHIARPREAIIHTGNIGVSGAEDEAAELAHLFDYYVAHGVPQVQSA